MRPTLRPKSWASLAGVAAMVLMSTILVSVGPAPAAAYENRWGANYFPNVELTDQYGHKLHFYDDLLKGKTVAIEQFYTHCIDICPLETARLAQVQKMLGDRVGKDIFFYSISIDPKRDTPEAMKEYADTYHAGPGWLFLTGKKEDIALINKKLGFQDPVPGDRDGHSPHLLLGNEATGQWIRNNALDNPRFIAIMIGDWMNSWQSKKENRMTSGQSYADAPAIKYDDHGKYVFFTQCAACHTIGGGESIGPDLKGLTKIRDPEWLKKIIQVPETLLDQGDPLANALLKKYKDVRMPNLHFDAATTDLLIGYMEKQSANVAPATEAPIQEQPR
jgi:protein SCO1/2